MGTKLDIQTKINTIDDGGLNTAEEVRSVLGTDPNSLLENIYGDVLTDTHLTQNIFTVDSNFEFNVNLTKVGRLIHISGSFKNTGATRAGRLIVNDSDYDSKLNVSFYGTSSIGRVLVLNYDLFGLVATRIDLGLVAQNESITFHVTYSANL